SNTRAPQDETNPFPLYFQIQKSPPRRQPEKQLHQEHTMSIEMIEVEEFNQGTQTKVIGVGGGGGNAVEHMISRTVQGVELICANTDAQALTRSAAHKTIQLGTSGLGAGSKPEKGRDAAEQAVDDIRSAIAGAHMLVI